MENENFDTSLREEVRRYSLIAAEATPDDTLCQALEESARKDEAIEKKIRDDSENWRRWLEFEEKSHDHVIARLQAQGKRVSEMWAEFSTLFKLGNTVGFGTGPPGIETLLSAVQGADKAWAKSKESGFGKIKTNTESFVNMMNDHSYIFSVIPEGSMYTSLVTGVISSLVKASVNHQKIADGFSEAVGDITSDLKTVSISTAISDTKHMRILVVDLYVEVFDFLCFTMQWYQHRFTRFKKAFNQNYANDVQKKVAKIRKVLASIRLAAEQTTQDRVKETHQAILKVEDVVNDLKVASDQQRRESIRDSQSLENYLEKISRQLSALGEDAKLVLLAAGQHVIYGYQRRDKVKLVLHDQSSTSLTPTQIFAADEGPCTPDGKLDIPAIPEALTRERVELWASHLDSFLIDGRADILKTSNTLKKPLLPREVLDKLQGWIRVPSSKVLWVQGPASVLMEKQLSLAAISVRDLVLNAGMPCISFFPKHRYDLPQPNSSSGASRQEKALAALLFTVVAQLVRLLPPEFVSTGGIDQQTFEGVDGSVDSIGAAMVLIETLLGHIMAPLTVVIDKLHLTDNKTTRPHLTRLIELLRDLRSGRLVKVLFTTAGGCVVLAETTKMAERVDARRMAQGKPGQPFRGWSSLDSLRVPNQG